MKKDLETYNKKRNFTKTNEPVGKKGKSAKKLHFVVQHHLARKDHYDFRLEWNGTLLSFAVPKGPSYNPNDKRLAVRVEDHPLSYRNFEGTIPKGEYGGGTVMIWDNGYWTPTGNPTTELKNGSLKFTLFGQRLQGKWTLVHFKDKNWLLIKEKDDKKGFKNISKLNTSIVTNRTMEEIEKNKESKMDTETKINSIKITNPEKVIYKSPKITKKDLIEYYKKIQIRMMPYLENRLISSIRCPNGIEKEKFFKKHFESSNKHLGKKIIKNENGKKEDYYYIKNPAGLIYEIQMNGYEIHIWGSKVNKLNKPDILVFDLDPDENLNLKKVREGVKDLKSVLDELHLTSFLKTSGGKGYHIVIPIQSIKTFEEGKDFTKNIAKIMEMKWPEKYTSNVRIENRQGKIFIDWIRNTKGATSVAPYSIRIKKKLSISMPIRWNELDKIKPNEITIEMALKRLKRKDPWENFWNIIQ